MRFFIIRHGKTRGNEEGRYLPPDEPLSERGIRELKEKRASGIYRELEEYLKSMEDRNTGRGITGLFVSPCPRCYETAERLFPGIRYREIEELREIDFGRFTGKNYNELNGTESYQKWIDSKGELPFPDGESKEDYIFRVMNGLVRIQTIMENSGRSLEVRPDKRDEADQIGVIVAHAGTIMAANHVINGKGYFDISPDFGGIYSFLFEGNRML